MPDPRVSMSTGDAAPRLALRPKDAARSIGISERLLWTMTKRGDVPHIRVGRTVLYPVDLLRDWLAKNAEGGGRP